MKSITSVLLASALYGLADASLLRLVVSLDHQLVFPQGSTANLRPSRVTTGARSSRSNLAIRLSLLTDLFGAKLPPISTIAPL